MPNNLSIFFVLFFLLIAAASPLYLFAQGGITNPLAGPQGATSIEGVFINITKWLLGIVAILALLALIVGGARMILSFGNESGVASAKKIIWWAVVGLAVVVASYAIIALVISDILGATVPP